MKHAERFWINWEEYWFHIIKRLCCSRRIFLSFVQISYYDIICFYTVPVYLFILLLCRCECIWLWFLVIKYIIERKNHDIDFPIITETMITGVLHEESFEFFVIESFGLFVPESFGLFVIESFGLFVAWDGHLFGLFQTGYILSDLALSLNL